MNPFDPLLLGLQQSEELRPLRFVIGEVVDDRDPDGLARVRVEADDLIHGQISPWLRVRTPDGGPLNGRVSVPEVGSQVLVAVWEDEATLDAAVLGALHTAAPPVAGPAAARLGPLLLAVEDERRLRLETVETATRADGKDGRLQLSVDAGDSSFRVELARLDLGSPTCALRLAGSSVRLQVSGRARMQGRRVVVRVGGAAQLGASKTIALRAPELDLGPR